MLTYAISVFPYLGVGDGEAVHRLRCLEQLNLLYDVRLGAQDHHPLQPALRCGRQRGTATEKFTSLHSCSVESNFQFNFTSFSVPFSAADCIHPLRAISMARIKTYTLKRIAPAPALSSDWLSHIQSSKVPDKHTSLTITVHLNINDMVL